MHLTAFVSNLRRLLYIELFSAQRLVTDFVSTVVFIVELESANNGRPLKQQF